MGSGRRAVLPAGSRVACLASWDNLYHAGEVVTTRRAADRDGKGAGSAPGSEAAGAAHANKGVELIDASSVEYYIHYVEYNKRLDEWVGESRVEPWTTMDAHEDEHEHDHGHGQGHADVDVKRRAELAADVDTEAHSPAADGPKRRRLDNPDAPADPGLQVGTLQAGQKLDTRAASGVKGEPGSAAAAATAAAGVGVESGRGGRNVDGAAANKGGEGGVKGAGGGEVGEDAAAWERQMRVKNFETVEIGDHEIDTWYFSPYPPHLTNTGPLFICDACLKYSTTPTAYERHLAKCQQVIPPGEEVYRARLVPPAPTGPTAALPPACEPAAGNPIPGACERGEGIQECKPMAEREGGSGGDGRGEGSEACGGVVVAAGEGVAAGSARVDGNLAASAAAAAVAAAAAAGHAAVVGVGMGGGGRGGGGGRREGSETGTAATGTETAAAAEAFAGLQFRVPGGGVGVGGGDDGTSGSDAAAAPAATGSDAKDADLERGPADVAGMGNSVSARDADVDRKGSARKQEGEGGKGEGVKGEAGRDGSGKEGSRKGEGGVGEGGVGEGGVGEGGVGEGGEGSEVKGEAQGQERGGSVGGRKDAERRGDGGREEGGVSKAEEGGGKETGGSGSGGDGGGGGGSGMLHVFRVDPAHAKLYCQCLSLLGKLFLEHKPRVYTVEGHTFYVLTRGSDTWHTLIGYFAIESSPPASPPPKHDSLAAGTETVDPHRLEAKAEAAPNAAQKLGSSHRVEVEATLEVMQKPAEPHRREAEEKATPKAPQGPSDSHRRDETCTTAANTAGDTGGGLAAAQPLPHEALHSSPSPLPPSPTPPAEVHLSSVVVLPPFQRRGFGRWLLSVAYDMTAARQQLLVPKPPLSDLGTVAFRSYWRWQLLRSLKKLQGNCSIDSLSKRTAIQPEDIRTALKQLKLTKYCDTSGNVSVPPGVLIKKTK
ncbi:unnamed protein product, partial [Closterium sp. NIES-64]